MTIALEVIATSVEDAVAAERGGASRIELVAALDRGGLTPALTLVDAVLARVSLPVRVMVRDSEPHEVPNPVVRARLVEQARAIGTRPIHGLVFGALASGRIDEALLDAVSGAAGQPVTFHRAFEEVSDPLAALVTLRRHPAVDRILCDGGAGTWDERASRLRRWAEFAGPSVTMLVGGGVTDEALVALAQEPSIREVHVGRIVREPPAVEGQVSVARVEAVVRRLEALRNRR
jgi:copper homeostasis protein